MDEKYDLKGIAFNFSGLPEIHALVKASIDYARTGLLKAPENTGLQNCAVLMKMGVYSAGGSQGVYKADGRDYSNYTQAREMVDVIAKNVRSNVQDIHPGARQGAGLGL